MPNATQTTLTSVFLFALAIGSQPSWLSATEIIQITPENYRDVVPAGKEVDAIHGDWVIRNRQVVAVIAQPLPGRKANMTVRGVAGMLIDFTRRYHGSDQLSCFYPAAGRYLFENAESFSCTVDGAAMTPEEAKNAQGEAISISFSGEPLAADGTTALVTYTLRDDQDWIEYRVQLSNASDGERKLAKEDSLRCDGNLFKMQSIEDLRLFYAEDQYFGQCYGFMHDEGVLARAGSGRNLVLRSAADSDALVAAGQSVTWSGKVTCSQGLPGVLSWAKAVVDGSQTTPVQLILQSPQGPVPHAKIEFFRGDASLGTIQSDGGGTTRTRLLPGSYLAVVRCIGREKREHEFVVEAAPRADTLSLPAASRVRARITDRAGRPIAAKVQFLGIEGTADPDYGPDSAIAAVKNVVYCARGRFEQPIDPGKYQVIVSHGPEYDAETREIEVKAGQLVQLTSSLTRSVHTAGWISSDFHSHSSPSGDNVSHQTGRVLNLLAEHIEFAPCTEHNRIDTYQDDLQLLGATRSMATCTGIELTGSPLPINHQNAFPLHRHEHEQDGGGPLNDADPVVQIERLALWDNSSSKVVQTNHPNIPQILGDRDLDGKPDDGFRGMLGWMDVIEVHPPQAIFTPPPADVAPKDKYSNPMFFWMRLINLGYRISGVVNTDAHYNFHGSGWLRNYMQSSTDDPAKISIEEMIHSAEHGHMIMTTGPFLEAEVRIERNGQVQRFVSGEDVELDSQGGRLWIRVQCPNWFDVNRVQVFANGRPIKQLNFTRKTHPKLFHDSSVRFELETDLPRINVDTHLIVATIGEGLTLGQVMGPSRGELPPVAVTNPIFLDRDGSGFQGNGDDLGVPFMLPQLAP